MQAIGIIWNNFLINPMINGTIVIAHVLFNNYGLAILFFTIALRLATLPLTVRQLHSQRKMTQLQPRINEIQKKYKDPKKRSEETMKLYKEVGANPAGCLLPMLIQFPIWISLYDVIRTVLGQTPESLISLSSRLYPWSFIQQAVPLGNHFLFWDMGTPDRSYVLPILVGASMWIQQKLTMTQATMVPGNSQQQQTNQTLLWMMPLMFAWFTLTVPSGLGLYWLVSNIIGVIMNYYVYGWKGKGFLPIFLSPSGPPKPHGQQAGGNERRRRPGKPALPEPAAPATESIAPPEDAEGQAPAAGLVSLERRAVNGRNGRGGSKRKDSRRSDRQGAQPTRPRPQSGAGDGP